MLEILSSLWKSKTARLIGAVLLTVLVVGGYFAYLTHERRQAEKEAHKQREENERLRQQSDGLKIIVNTANTAAEVEKLQEKANAQSQNSNISNTDYFNSYSRDSNSFAGNFNAAKERFCRNFPNDSKCQPGR